MTKFLLCGLARQSSNWQRNSTTWRRWVDDIRDLRWSDWLLSTPRRLSKRPRLACAARQSFPRREFSCILALHEGGQPEVQLGGSRRSVADSLDRSRPTSERHKVRTARRHHPAIASTGAVRMESAAHSRRTARSPGRVDQSKRDTARASEAARRPAVADAGGSCDAQVASTKDLRRRKQRLRSGRRGVPGGAGIGGAVQEPRVDRELGWHDRTRVRQPNVADYRSTRRADSAVDR